MMHNILGDHWGHPNYSHVAMLHRYKGIYGIKSVYGKASERVLKNCVHYLAYRCLN